MAIQVGSSIHAAVTMYAVAAEAQQPTRFLQSPQGCILQRFPINEGATNAWIVLLDYGLDSGSAAFCFVPFASEDPRTQQPSPVVPILFHIDDRVKVIVTVARDGDEWEPRNQSFHALFMNYQANQQELYPVDVGVLPTLPQNPGPLEPPQ